MTADVCVLFLTALRCKNIHVKDNGWVAASCPLAKWTHTNHTDSSPSFGLSVQPGGRSYFLCFACMQGSAEELLHTIEMYSHDSQDYDFKRCHELLSDEEYVVPLPEYGEFPTQDQVFTEWPTYWLESFTPVEWVVDAAQYLMYRGVTVEQAQIFQLRYDSKRHMVVFPYWDVFNRLAGARGRAVHDDASYKHHDYSYQGVNNARLVWYNEIVLNLPGPVVVVEGQFDCLRTAQAFPKVVANLTAKPTMEKMRKLGDCGKVIQIPDRDDAGWESTKRYAHLCQQLDLEHRVVWLDEGVKDPGECSPGYLKDRIQEVL